MILQKVRKHVGKTTKSLGTTLESFREWQNSGSAWSLYAITTSGAWARILKGKF